MAGVGAYLKEISNGAVQVMVVEPAESRVLVHNHAPTFTSPPVMQSIVGGSFHGMGGLLLFKTNKTNKLGLHVHVHVFVGGFFVVSRGWV